MFFGNCILDITLTLENIVVNVIDYNKIAMNDHNTQVNKELAYQF
jgi:hypothetical protein